MPTKQEKQLVVQELKEKFSKAQAVVLADQKGVTVEKITEVRTKLREAGCDMKVAKNTLSKIAAKEQGLEGLDEYFVGPTVMAFAMEDPTSVAKIMTEFAKDVKGGVQIKAGVLEGKLISQEQIKELAELPSREVLLGKVLAGMQAPMYGFANVLAANLRNLVYVLEAIRKQKEAEAS